MTISDSQRAAKARYDKRRPAPVSVRLNACELAWLDAQRLPGEGRSPAMKRLANFHNREEQNERA